MGEAKEQIERDEGTKPERQLLCRVQVSSDGSNVRDGRHCVTAHCNGNAVPIPIDNSNGVLNALGGRSRFARLQEAASRLTTHPRGCMAHSSR